VHTHSDAHLSPYKTSSSPRREEPCALRAFGGKTYIHSEDKIFSTNRGSPFFFSIQVCHQMGVFKTINLIFEKRHHLSLPSFCLV